MPVDRGAIDAQLREIGEGDRWWEQREFRALPHILHADEQLRGLANGKILGRRRPRLRPAPKWLLVATSQRLIFLKQERFARKQVEIAAGHVVRMYGGAGMRTYQITIHSPERRYRLRLSKETAFRFMASVQPLMPNPPAQLADPGAAPGPWLPGLGALTALPGVAGMVSMASGQSRGDFASREHVARLENALERVSEDVERLQQQVAFLEDLLQKRAEQSYLPQSSSTS
jgi:hypothetical protein